VKEPSGIRLDIYRNSGPDWSNLGISYYCSEVTLILPGGGPFKPTEEAPAVVIEKGPLGSLRAVECGKEGWSMMGGCYVASSDSRFSAWCEELLGHRWYGAVALHDRHEKRS
jgi:hypothetical protein